MLLTSVNAGRRRVRNPVPPTTEGKGQLRPRRVMGGRHTSHGATCLSPGVRPSPNIRSNTHSLHAPSCSSQHWNQQITILFTHIRPHQVDKLVLQDLDKLERVGEHTLNLSLSLSLTSCLTLRLHLCLSPAAMPEAMPEAMLETTPETRAPTHVHLRSVLMPHMPMLCLA